jgi:hypothetical protein
MMFAARMKAHPIDPVLSCIPSYSDAVRIDRVDREKQKNSSP